MQKSYTSPVGELYIRYKIVKALYCNVVLLFYEIISTVIVEYFS